MNHTSDFNDEGKDEPVGITIYATYFVFEVFFDLTGFVTCLISVTRMIKVLRPFYSISGTGVAASFLIYCLCSFAREGVQAYLSYHVSLTSNVGIQKYHLLFICAGTTLNVIFVFFSTVVTAQWLLTKSKVNSNISENRRYATLTVIVLSGVFCFINTTGICLAVIAYFKNVKGNIHNSKSALRFANYVNLIILLNSAVNPIVYLARKKDMRIHISNTLRKVTRIRKQETVEETNMNTF